MNGAPAPDRYPDRPGPPATLSLPEKGPIVATVTGHPTLTIERRDFLGLRVLAVAVTLAMMMSFAFVLASGPHALGPLLAPVVIVLLLVALYQIVVNVILRRGRAGGMGATRQAGASPSRGHEVAVQRFRLTPVAGGALVECVMYGEPHGHDLRHADVVRANGRRGRSGVYLVQRVDVLAGPTGPVVGHVTARPGLRFRAARLASQLSFVLTGLVAVWVAMVLVGILS